MRISDFSSYFQKLALPNLMWLIFLVFFQLSCIHFKLGDTSPQKAANLEYQEPPRPFELNKNTSADTSWQSRKTGNIIALFSDCSKSSDKPLSIAFNEITKGFDRFEIQKKETLFFNHREALQALIKGTIDGISVSMESLIFNKNQCFYQLTYSGVTEEFEKEKNYFEQFKKDFKAP